MAVTKVIQELPPGSRILDFGCSTGRLLASFTAIHKCFGFDLNQAAGRQAHEKGLYVLSETELASARDESFDVVTLVDVFEHLIDPVPLLRRLVALIKPDGLLILVTGNADSAACQFDPAQFWGNFCIIEHVVMLTRRHAEWLCRSLGADLHAWNA